jgi:hypothetical protein
MAYPSLLLTSVITCCTKGGHDPRVGKSSGQNCPSFRDHARVNSVGVHEDSMGVSYGSMEARVRYNLAGNSSDLRTRQALLLPTFDSRGLTERRSPTIVALIEEAGSDGSMQSTACTQLVHFLQCSSESSSQSMVGYTLQRSNMRTFGPPEPKEGSR